MANYKVLVQAHQLKNQLIAGFNEIVDESQLMGNASSLEAEGFIELVEDDSDKVLDISKLKKPELIEFCKLNGFDIDEKDTVAVILSKIEAQTVALGLLEDDSDKEE